MLTTRVSQLLRGNYDSLNVSKCFPGKYLLRYSSSQRAVSRNYNKPKRKGRSPQLTRVYRKEENSIKHNVVNPSNTLSVVADSDNHSNHLSLLDSNPGALDKLADIAHEVIFSESGGNSPLEHLQTIDTDKLMIDISRDTEPSEERYTLLIQAQSAQGKAAAAFRTFERLHLVGLKPSEETYVAIVKACFDAGKLTEARQVYRDLRQNAMGVDLKKLHELQTIADPTNPNSDNPLLWKPKRKPAILVHSATVEGLVNSGRLEEARQLVVSLEDDATNLYGNVGCEENGVWPNAEAYSAVIKGTLRKHDFKECWKLYRRMLYGGTTPNAEVLCSLISVCAKTSEPEHALKLFEEHGAWDVEPTRDTYHAVISACSKTLQYNREAFWLFHQMRSEGIRPNVNTYNIMLDACGLSGDVMVAKQVLRQMRKEGLEPDSVTYTTMLNVYARSQRLKPPVPDPNQPRTPPLGLTKIEKPRLLQKKMEYVIGRSIEDWEYNKNDWDFDYKGEEEQLHNSSSNINQSDSKDKYSDYASQYNAKPGPTSDVLEQLNWAKGSSAFGLEAITEEREARGEIFGEPPSRLLSYSDLSMGCQTRFKKPNPNTLKTLPLPFLPAGENLEPEFNMRSISRNNATPEISQIKANDTVPVEPEILALAENNSIPLNTSTATIRDKESEELVNNSNVLTTVSTSPELQAYRQLNHDSITSNKPDELVSKLEDAASIAADVVTSANRKLTRGEIQKQNIKEATQLFESMLEYGIQPTSHSLNAYLKVFTEARRFASAERILSLFPKFGLKTTAHTYGSIVKAYTRSKHGRLLPKALQYKTLMESKGFHLSGPIYAMLINRLALNNRLEEALQLTKEARTEHGLKLPESFLQEVRTQVKKLETRLDYDTRPEHTLKGFKEGEGGEKEKMEDLMLLALESLPPEPYWWVKTDLVASAQRSKSKNLKRTKARLGTKNLFSTGGGRGFAGMG